jgi:hypothetical protein
MASKGIAIAWNNDIEDKDDLEVWDLVEIFSWMFPFFNLVNAILVLLVVFLGVFAVAFAVGVAAADDDDVFFAVVAVVAVESVILLADERRFIEFVYLVVAFNCVVAHSFLRCGICVRVLA